MDREQAEAVVDAFEAAVSEGNDRLRDAMRRLILSVMCEERSYPITVSVPDGMGSQMGDYGYTRVTRTWDDPTVSHVTRPLSERV